MKAWQKYVVAGFALALVAISVVIYIFTQTDFGRDRFRTLGLEQLANRVHGIVSVGDVHGNLLTGVVIEDVVIVDSAGRPFLSADTLEMRYSLRSLMRKHIVLQDVRLVRPLIVLDQPPGEKWNFERLFPGDTVRAETEPERVAFGDWVRIEDMSVIDGTVLVRRTWNPPSASGASRDAVIRHALSDANREHVVPAAGGYQSLSKFSEVDGEFPLIVFADPDSSARVIDVASLSTIAQPFRPPAVEVQDFAGRVRIGADTVWLQRARIALPGSRLALHGTYDMSDQAVNARIRADTLSLADLRFARPDLPAGRGHMDIAVAHEDGMTRAVLTDMELRAEGAHVRGKVDVQVGRVTRVGSSDVAFDGVDTRLLERLLPGTDVPVEGVINGHVQLAGTADRLDVDGWTLFRDRAGAESRITADGVIASRPAGTFAQDLALRFDPLRVTLLRAVVPDLPIGGVITGRATLDGNLNARFDVDADVVHVDPGIGRSRIVAAGDIAPGEEFTTQGLRMRFDPVQAALLRAFQPDLELDGSITGRATLAGGLASGFDVDADVVHTSAATGRSRVVADGRITTRAGFAARNLHLRLDPLQMALVHKFAPDLELEEQLTGQLTGRATLTGELARGFTVDADIVHTGGGTGRSHITAVGDVLTADGISARGLRLTLDPLQVALLKQFDPTLPIDGTVAGRLTLSGSPETRIAVADMAITHEGSTGTSVIAGNADLQLSAAGVQRVDADLRVRPLSLATAGLFAPSARLHGTVTGTVIARGTRNDITFNTDLRVQDGGAIAAQGNLALGTMRYDVRSTMSAFDPASISTLGPTAALTGRVTAVGTGTDPATARASIDAALVDSRIPGAPGVDSTRIIATVADGLATIDRGHVRLASAVADVEGTFGLVAGRTGVLRYDVAIDTLAHIARFAAGDTTVVYPRPGPQARRIAMARADSARVAEQTLVERIATGRPAEPQLSVDSLRPIPRDTIAGMLRAQGRLTGNVESFDAEGTATLRDVLFRGNAVESGDIAFDITNALSAQPEITLDAELTGVYAGGFAFDSAHVAVGSRGGLRRGTGTADIAVFQDPGRDYRLSSEFVLALDRSELRLDDLALRFDSTVWQSTQPGAISWASAGVELRGIDVRNGEGGRVQADGRIPTEEGSGDLRIAIDSMQIADIAALLQDTLDMRGMLTLDARVQGTARAPVIAGTLAVDSASRAGTTLPALRSTFEYANQQLTADATLMSGVRQLLAADVRLPVDLALSGRTGPILLDGPVMVDATMDSLALSELPVATPAVQDIRGVVSGDVSVRGTFDDPQLSGLVRVSEAGLHIVDAGVELSDAVGTFHLEGDRIRIDSLVAMSGGQPIHVQGGVDVATLTRPEFDLAVRATDAVVLDNERGRIRADVDVTVQGPLDAVRVEGTLAVQEGLINAPEQTNLRRATNLDDPMLLATLDTLNAPEQFRRGPHPLLRNLVMDVRVTIERDTWVRNSSLNVEIYTPDDVDALRVRVENAQQAIRLEGTINADRGEYAVAGRQFQLTAGSFTFLGARSIDPMLQLNAQYEVPRRNREALIIQINIGGHLSEPTLALSSNAQPPLPESELISYLAFGRTSSSLLTQEGSGLIGGGIGLLAEQQLAALGLGAFTDAIVRTLEEEGTDAGVDVFRIRPGSVPDELSTGGYFRNLASGTELEIGEYFGKRLFGAVEARATGAWPGLRVEYETASGFSWRTTWEPIYRPSAPSFAETQAVQGRVLGTFFFWTRRF